MCIRDRPRDESRVDASDFCMPITFGTFIPLLIVIITTCSLLYIVWGAGDCLKTKPIGDLFSSSSMLIFKKPALLSFFTASCLLRPIMSGTAVCDGLMPLLIYTVTPRCV